MFIPAPSQSSSLSLEEAGVDACSEDVSLAGGVVAFGEDDSMKASLATSGAGIRVSELGNEANDDADGENTAAEEVSLFSSSRSNSLTFSNLRSSSSLGAIRDVELPTRVFRHSANWLYMSARAPCR